jgi:hypothetical protein
VRERWLSKRALWLHAGLLFVVPGCAAAAWWQITRATDGNGLSYLYAVEWPIFAILGVYFWWMLIHTDYDTVGLRGMRAREQKPALAASPVPVTATPPMPSSDDPELDAYNARLAALAERGPKTWREPETVVARVPR